MAEEEVYRNEEGEETFAFSTMELKTMVQMRIMLGLLILPCPNLVICLNWESCLNRESIQSIYSH